MKVHLFPIGPFASGKTKRGKEAAEILGLDFVDTDQIIESYLGASIGQLPKIVGEKEFAKVEKHIVIKTVIALKTPSVVSMGGSIVYASELMRFLSFRGYMIHIKTPTERIIQRLKERGEFSVLNPNNLPLDELVAERNDLCAKYADAAIQAEDDKASTSRLLAETYLKLSQVV